MSMLFLNWSFISSIFHVFPYNLSTFKFFGCFFFLSEKNDIASGDQLRALRQVFEGSWEFTQPVHMCVVDLGTAFDRVPQPVLSGVLQGSGALC